MRVFLSSTCYDLADLRAALEKALRDLGHEPLLSDRDAFPVQVGRHRHDVCLDAAGDSDLMLVVIDSRFGAPYHADPNISVTWAEFRTAANRAVPIVAFVRKSVWFERQIARKNPDIELTYCDNKRTFEFISEVQGHANGYWIGQFENVTEIISKLPHLEVHAATRGAVLHSRISTSRLSSESQELLRGALGELPPDIGSQELEKCLAAIPKWGTWVGAVMADELDRPLGPGGIYCYRAMRPAEDDLTSYFAVIGPTPTGMAVDTELKGLQTALAGSLG